MKEIDIVTEIRGFNRFYTDILGLLNQRILDSGYSLTEARILFEISKCQVCTANQLCSALNIDRSYMSRIIRKFEKDGLVKRENDSNDNRNMLIQMTAKGETIFHDLNERSNKQIEEMLSKLDNHDCEDLIRAIRTVKKYFMVAEKNMKIRPYSEKDIKYVIDRQLSLYEAERHFVTQVWKDYLIKGVLSLVKRFDKEKDCMLILECDENPMGCIAITHVQEYVAQLRYFFLEPELRGLGAGTKLLNAALEFCEAKKYQKVFLWTVSAQESARKLYKKAGFEITETHENSDWGSPVLEEKWELDIGSKSNFMKSHIPQRGKNRK